jgi:hypothetical protein
MSVGGEFSSTGCKDRLAVTVSQPLSQSVHLPAECGVHHARQCSVVEGSVCVPHSEELLPYPRLLQSPLVGAYLHTRRERGRGKDREGVSGVQIKLLMSHPRRSPYGQ